MRKNRFARANSKIEDRKYDKLVVEKRTKLRLVRRAKSCQRLRPVLSEDASRLARGLHEQMEKETAGETAYLVACLCTPLRDPRCRSEKTLRHSLDTLQILSKREHDFLDDCI